MWLTQWSKKYSYIWHCSYDLVIGAVAESLLKDHCFSDWSEASPSWSWEGNMEGKVQYEYQVIRAKTKCVLSYFSWFNRILILSINCWLAFTHWLTLWLVRGSLMRAMLELPLSYICVHTVLYLTGQCLRFHILLTALYYFTGVMSIWMHHTFYYNRFIHIRISK